ncbi:Bor/Iss family lipoprotein [Altibacter sp. HG106]|uniref:Bor/Iss family lipoprotein n=1 Tax=Altibacter sp. HG106 TaxID=3023937 RepID=UPI002350291E|nr:hypothetical protein [Altibacter sp. HG106]MDC7994045.1 hypothetical protein [Altibacter sp. HG106]
MKAHLFTRFLLVLIANVAILMMCNACMSTQVIANYHSDTLDNEACHELSHWKYWWGIGGSDEVLVGPNSPDTDCPCANNAMASVEVKSSFGDFLLNFVTLGIVNHRTVSYKCAEVDEGEQGRDHP